MRGRSRDFGNPQCRSRLYIFGARDDLVEPDAFQAMLRYFRNLGGEHKQSGLQDVVDWVGKLKRRGPILHVPCNPCKPKDIRRHVAWAGVGVGHGFCVLRGHRSELLWMFEMLVQNSKYKNR